MTEENLVEPIEVYSKEDAVTDVVAYNPLLIKELDKLPVESRLEVFKIKDSINLSETSSITNYGSECQKSISDLSQQILGNIKTKNVGEVGNLVTELMKTMKDTDLGALDGKTNFLMKMFYKIKDPIDNFLAKNENLAENIKKVASDMAEERLELIKSINTLDQMFELCHVYHDNIQNYIFAGKLKIEEESKKVSKLEAIANESGDLQDVQAFEDCKRTIERFNKRLHDMELTKQVILLQAPQIRQMQSTNMALADEIQNSLVNAIPAWQSSLVITVEGYKANKTMKIQNGLRSVLNKSLVATSEMLKETTVEVAKMGQKGLIDLSTIESMHKNLIESFTKVKQIASESESRAKEETSKLIALEDSYKKKMLNG
mgnify:CR=1 FL=1